MSRRTRTRTTTSRRPAAASPLRRRVAATALVLLAGPLAAGCTGDGTDTGAPAGAPADGSTVMPGEAGDALELGTLSAPDVRPDGVLIAALLLAGGGDVEEAVADGLVTPAEVDTAAAALDDGTLAAWVAEAGLPVG